MGDYSASHGSFSGSMAQKMRAERLSMADNQSPVSAGGGSQNSPLSGSIGPATTSPIETVSAENESSVMQDQEQKLTPASYSSPASQQSENQ